MSLEDAVRAVTHSTRIRCPVCADNRKGNNKTQAILYDIADDITYNSRKNNTLNHLIERIKIYNEEDFNYEIIKINFKK
jgi:hypothetical protein